MLFIKKNLQFIFFIIIALMQPCVWAKSVLVTDASAQDIDTLTYLRLGVAETLIAVDASGKLVPKLAKSWSVNNEKSVWTITLKRGVRFSNGRLVTAQHVADALKIAKRKNTPLKKAPITRIEAKNGTISFTLYRAYSGLPAVLAHHSSLILSPDSYDENGQIKKVIGTGALIIRAASDEHIAMTPNPKFRGKRAKISEVTYRLTSQAFARESLLYTAPNDGVTAIA